MLVVNESKKRRLISAFRRKHHGKKRTKNKRYEDPEKKKIPYEIHRYECREFIDGIAIADMLNEPYERVFKTLVTEGKSGGYFVFVIPIHKELDLKKAARAVHEKSVEMIHVKDINKITGYIRGGCTAIGMKKEYPTILDQSAEDQETIMVSGGKNGIQLELKPEDYLKACRGVTASLTREEETEEV